MFRKNMNICLMSKPLPGCETGSFPPNCDIIRDKIALGQSISKAAFLTGSQASDMLVLYICKILRNFDRISLCVFMMESLQLLSK